MSGHTEGPWSAAFHRQMDGGVRMYWVNDLTSVGTRNVADVKLIAAAPKLLDLAKQYASECGECGGTGLVTLIGAYYGGDADDQPCLECEDIRAVIAEAGGGA